MLIGDGALNKPLVMLMGELLCSENVCLQWFRLCFPMFPYHALPYIMISSITYIVTAMNDYNCHLLYNEVIVW